MDRTEQEHETGASPPRPAGSPSVQDRADGLPSRPRTAADDASPTDHTPAANDTWPSHENPSTVDTPTADGPRTSPLDPNDRVTRLLCAGTYLHGSYASHVTNSLLAPSARAICPPWGVDAVWLARHAVEAKRWRRERDVQLACALAAVLVGGAGVLALLLLGDVPVVIALIEWFLLWAAGYAVAFVLVFRHYRMARKTAVSLAYDPQPPAAPPLADAAQEDRLSALGQANTVVFARTHMFAGSGQRLDHATMTVDISRGAKRDDNTRSKPKRFDGLDLHRELLETVGKGMRPKPRAAHRLFVRGGFTLDVPIFPHGPVDGDLAQEMAFRRPVNHVPDELLEHFLRWPNEAARVYSVFEQYGWGGQVAVTLFVRGRVEGKTLFLELDVFAQQQLRGAFGDVSTIRMRHGDEIPALVRSVLPVALPLLLGSAARRWRARKGDRSDAKHLREVARDLERHRDIDVGAISSLREDSSGQTVGESDRFPWADEEMYYQILFARVLDCIKDFLVRKNIDTSSFERQQVIFVERTTINARDIYGSAVNKGVNKTRNSSGSEGDGSSGADKS